MSDISIPDLTFTNVILGVNETPWDLQCLLYLGGAGAKTNQVAGLIRLGSLGKPIIERLELVVKLHEEIAGELAGGGSKETALTQIRNLRQFFAWVDQSSYTLSLVSVENTYIHWSDYLLNRCRVIQDLSEITTYSLAYSVANVLDKVLERRISLIGKTRIRRPRKAKKTLGIEADKQNLQNTFAFGFTLMDICDALTIEAVRGPIPVVIPFREGGIFEVWAGKQPIEKLKWSSPPQTASQRFNAKKFRKLREAWEADTSLKTRHSIVNLRVESELLIFIAQTGINLAQAIKLKTGQFHYASHLNGYQVRRYKNRRGGEVEFEIFAEYRDIFERYLTWRSNIFPDDPDGLLFKMSRISRADDSAPQFARLKAVCKSVGIQFISSRFLRNTRINWLLRRSRDPNITAEMAQHAQETLLRSYAKPHFQVAMVEVSQFHKQTDPSISPPGPGFCISQTPEPVPNIPYEATQPDCQTAAGCLFCTHQRDIDSEYHVWSLTSFRHLKSLELIRFRPPNHKAAQHDTIHPANITIERITAKLLFFQKSSPIREIWVIEALKRVDEGDYHPYWDGFIQLLEIHP
jgi:hypothetical protein